MSHTQSEQDLALALDFLRGWGAHKRAIAAVEALIATAPHVPISHTQSERDAVILPRDTVHQLIAYITVFNAQETEDVARELINKLIKALNAIAPQVPAKDTLASLLDQQSLVFYAKRLRRACELMGVVGVPDEDETLIGCLGTVLGQFCQQVESLCSSVAPQVPANKPLRTLIDSYRRACRRDGNPAWESDEGRALSNALQQVPATQEFTDAKINQLTQDVFGKWPSFEAQSWACKVVHAVLNQVRPQVPAEADMGTNDIYMKGYLDRKAEADSSDTKRLDFLIANAGRVNRIAGNFFVKILSSENYVGRATTARAAIDAAIAAKDSQP